MSLMLDTVAFLIPVFDIYAKQVSGSKTKWEIIGDVNDYGLTASSRHIVKRDGIEITFEKYHANESIPTSHTGIGFKFYHVANNSKPYVYLNASIAKIRQGHNVFGDTNMIYGVLEILHYFKEAYPKFYQFLDVANAQISRFDVTLPMQTQNAFTAQRIRDYCRNINWGRYRNLSVDNTKAHYNTIYFGSENSRVGGFKLYCKGIELQKEIKNYEQEAKKGSLSALAKLNIYTKQLQEYANHSVRIEATAMRNMIREWGYPLNLWQFLEFQLENPHIYEQIFKHKTKAFFEALDGMTMIHADDGKVWQLLHDKLTTLTPTGKISTTKARHAYNFYKRLKDDGFLQVKATTDERTFRRCVKSLVDAGFSRAYLQNLTKNDEIPVLRLLNLDVNLHAPNPNFAPPAKVSFDFAEFAHFFPTQKVA